MGTGLNSLVINWLEVSAVQLLNLGNLLTLMAQLEREIYRWRWWWEGFNSNSNNGFKPTQLTLKTDKIDSINLKLSVKLKLHFPHG